MDLLRALLKDSLITPVLPPLHLQHGGHLEIAEMVSKFHACQKANKKMLEDSKKYGKSLKGLTAMEVRLLSDLQNSGVAKEGDGLKEVLNGHQAIANQAVRESCDIERLTNETMTEPLKKFQKAFAAINDRLRAREEQVKNIEKTTRKLDDLRKSEFSSSKKWKIHPLILQKEKMEAEFIGHERLLVEELKALFELRLKYFQPILQSHALAQVNFYGEQTKIFCDVTSGFRSELPTIAAGSNREFQEYVNSQMNRLSQLKIVRGGDAKR